MSICKLLCVHLSFLYFNLYPSFQFRNMLWVQLNHQKRTVFLQEYLTKAPDFYPVYSSPLIWGNTFCSFSDRVINHGLQKHMILLRLHQKVSGSPTLGHMPGSFLSLHLIRWVFRYLTESQGEEEWVQSDIWERHHSPITHYNILL